MTWCADWWAHREAAARVESLWAAWELAQAEGGASPSQWWVYHFTPHWAALTDARRPFAGCTAGHVDDPARSPLPAIQRLCRALTQPAPHDLPYRPAWRWP